MKCENCGANVGNARFCPVCGARITQRGGRGRNETDFQDFDTDVQAKSSGNGLITAIIIIGVIILAAAAILMFLIFGPGSRQPEADTLPSGVSSKDSIVYQPVQTDTPSDTTSVYQPVQTTAPSDTASYGPSEDDLKYADEDLVHPSNWAWNYDYVNKTVKSRHGNYIYMLYGPDSEYEHMRHIDEGTEVIELAQENGYSLVVCGSRYDIGWCKTELLK